MSYQVLARKYRPQRFSDVVGQDHVTTTLSNAIQQKRIAHAFLFCGPRGTGKTTIARIFAKCLNCTAGPSVDFPDDDPRCQEIAEGRSMDVLEIDGASNNGVEQVRELRETVKYAPASSRFKIYIIDEVHMLSTAAFNALLKTLEEPPPHVKFMFATTEPEKVLPTILSRCQRFDLRRIPLRLIIRHIRFIAEREAVKVDEKALHAIARGADGCMRDAESTLDQLISFCGEQIVEEDVLSMFGLMSQSQLAELSQALLSANAEGALRVVNDLTASGKDLNRLLSDLLNHFRDLLLYKVSNKNLALMEASESEVATLDAQSKLADPAALTRVMEVFTDAEIRFRDAASRKTLMELTMVKAIEAREALNIDAVLQALKEIRSKVSSDPPALLSTSTSSESVPMPSPNDDLETPKAAASVPPGFGGSGTALETLWARLLTLLERASRFTHTYLVQAHAVSMSGGVLTIGFDPEFEDQMGLADSAKTRELLQTKLGELGHPGTRVKFVKAEASSTQRRPPPAPLTDEPAGTRSTAQTASIQKGKGPAKKATEKCFDKEGFRNDPLIQKALEIFKGQIVEVRG